MTGARPESAANDGLALSSCRAIMDAHMSDRIAGMLTVATDVPQLAVPALVRPSDRCPAAATRPLPQAACCGALRSGQPGDVGAAGNLHAVRDPVCGEAAD